jgi:integrase
VRRTTLRTTKVQIKGQRYWLVTWPKPTELGRNRRFFRIRIDAKNFVAQKAIELEDYRRAEMALTDRQRFECLECTEMLKPFGKTIRDAVGHFISHLKVTQKSRNAEQLVAELLKAKEQDGVSGLHLNNLKRLNRFTSHFNGRPVATITNTEIDDWLRSLRVAPRTRNHYRGFASQAFNFAIRNGYATVNPAAGAVKVKVISEAPGILTVEQTTRLLQSATVDILPFIAIGAFAGLRRAEIERLDWSEIDFERGHIEVFAKNAKTAMRRLVPLSPNLREWLLPLRKDKGNVTPTSCFRELFEAARAAAGITDWKNNCLRHGYAFYRLAATNDAAKTSLELGHSDARITFQHYRELVKPADAEQYWQIAP